MHIETTLTSPSVDPLPNQQSLLLRQPCLDDAAAIHDLIVHCPPLDINSLYAYLLLTHHHATNCVVAIDSTDQVRGYISAYIPPQTPDVLFVWQVAVHEQVRGIGLGKRMLIDILARPELQPIRHIETTVSPDNLASRHMFASLARQYGTSISETPLFEAQHFGPHAHEDEYLLRIGPIHAAPHLRGLS